ncbi:hypothetical protein FVP74_04915 [Microbacterium saccharophilum]|uniref:Uncharacterized protein n=1 Tax=Microbacterium saccharophilum TaxID=1213358 RepID=A0A5C8I7S4_9MICO|nr:hypothetical protein [Microbacterium saccharophilum]TXK13945.1 hypothetical protein FVP74_04915 [Microbacterium saccharophilum]
MTAVIAPRTLARATWFERALLTTSDRIDAFVLARLERRVASSRPARTVVSALDVRATASTYGFGGRLNG